MWWWAVVWEGRRGTRLAVPGILMDEKGWMARCYGMWDALGDGCCVLEGKNGPGEGGRRGMKSPLPALAVAEVSQLSDGGGRDESKRPLDS